MVETNQEEVNAMEFDTNPEETDAAVEHQEVRNEEMNRDHIRALED
jgi:hypothetical protein